MSEFDRQKHYDGYEVAILEDSVASHGERLTTIEVTFPRFILAEFNTHKVFSRNSASSRAIPVEKQLTKLLDHPFIPVWWGAAQSGMQANREIDAENIELATDTWLELRDRVALGVVALIGGVEKLKDENLKDRFTEMSKSYRDQKYVNLSDPLHKQNANRLLEPFMWHTVIVTSTEWDNYYALRANKDAQPEIQVAAQMMLDAHSSSNPRKVEVGDWHTPLLNEEERGLPSEKKLMISIGRCARSSYLTHHGVRDISEDARLYERLVESGHMSPTEHVGTPFTGQDWELVSQLQSIISHSSVDDHQKVNLSRLVEFSGNFRGWHQQRKRLPHEYNFGDRPTE